MFLEHHRRCTATKTDHALGRVRHKSRDVLETSRHVFSDNNGIELGINHKTSRKTPNIYK